MKERKNECPKFEKKVLLNVDLNNVNSINTIDKIDNVKAYNTPTCFLDFGSLIINGKEKMFYYFFYKKISDHVLLFFF